MKKFIPIILGILIIGIYSNAIDYPDAYKKVQQATGMVTYKILEKDIFGIEYKQNPRASCVFIEKNRCFTNAHLFMGKPIGMIIVQLEREGATPTSLAKIDYWDGVNDLVILKTEKEMPVEPVKLADNCMVGEDVMFGGYGNFPFPRIRFGKLNYRDRYGYYINDMYYGDSGSGIFNMKGELMGILYAIWEWSEEQKKPSTMKGYAMPIEILREYLKS